MVGIFFDGFWGLNGCIKGTLLEKNGEKSKSDPRFFFLLTKVTLCRGFSILYSLARQVGEALHLGNVEGLGS